jgi:hypothetical protein
LRILSQYTRKYLVQVKYSPRKTILTRHYSCDRLLERYSIPVARGRRVFFEVNNVIRKWLGAPGWIDLDGMRRLEKQSVENVRRLFLRLLWEARRHDGNDVRFLAGSVLERLRERITDLITVVETDDFREPAKALAALQALEDAREQKRKQELQQLVAQTFASAS